MPADLTLNFRNNWPLFNSLMLFKCPESRIRVVLYLRFVIYMEDIGNLERLSNLKYEPTIGKISSTRDRRKKISQSFLCYFLNL